jgi:hypothetical protein
MGKLKNKSMNNKHKKYLDELRESGVTNMFLAVPYLVNRFNIDRSTASKILKEWMETFKD